MENYKRNRHVTFFFARKEMLSDKILLKLFYSVIVGTRTKTSGINPEKITEIFHWFSKIFISRQKIHDFFQNISRYSELYSIRVFCQSIQMKTTNKGGVTLKSIKVNAIFRSNTLTSLIL